MANRTTIRDTRRTKKKEMEVLSTAWQKGIS